MYGMKILIDARLLSNGGTSGIEEYTRNLLSNLWQIDQKNEYQLFYNGLRKLPITHNSQLITNNYGLIDWKIPNKLLDFSTRFFRFPAIEDFIKTDLIFSPHFNILTTKKIPRVITFHDLSFLHHPQFFSWKQKFWHWMQNVKTQAQAADKIIAVSEFTKSDLVNIFGIQPEKIEVIYSGISDSFGKIASSVSRRTRNDDKPYILYLGTLEPRKNVAAIIRAFNILKREPAFQDWQLILAGRPGWLYQNIIKEAGRSLYKKDIIFLGPVRAEERVSLYNSARVFVYPSFFEGFGFPPLEAQACGCPVVVSDRTSLPEVVGRGALLINPWKIEELANAIKEAAANQILRARLIKEGKANAKRFTWKKSAEETLKIFQSYES